MALGARHASLMAKPTCVCECARARARARACVSVRQKAREEVCVYTCMHACVGVGVGVCALCPCACVCACVSVRAKAQCALASEDRAGRHRQDAHTKRVQLAAARRMEGQLQDRPCMGRGTAATGPTEVGAVRACGAAPHQQGQERVSGGVCQQGLRYEGRRQDGRAWTGGTGERCEAGRGPVRGLRWRRTRQHSRGKAARLPRAPAARQAGTPNQARPRAGKRRV